MISDFSFEGECNEDCERRFIVSVAQSGDGAACPSQDDAPECNPGDDECIGCEASCDGSGEDRASGCDNDGASCAGCNWCKDGCTAAELGLCEDKDCDGEWGPCSEECEREWTSTQERQGNGSECPEEPECENGDDECTEFLS